MGIVCNLLSAQSRPSESYNFGLFPVRSPLLRESRLISFPPVTEMFHFPGLSSHNYFIHYGIPLIFTRGGFPHSEIPGSQVACTSPRLFAAYHVLHLQPQPRHPPNTLTYLAISFHPVYKLDDLKYHSQTH